MSARVFISCGQNSPMERDVSNQLADWFRQKGYEPYVAVTIQTIADLNAGIIDALKASDYYVFVNFKREEVIRAGGNVIRGSLYSHQELAVAYALGFQHILIANEDGIHDEGVQKFMVTNIPPFKDYVEVLPLIVEAVAKARWHPAYSRQLSSGATRWGDLVYYPIDNKRGICPIRVFHCDIHNNRNDQAAYRVVAQLNRIVNPLTRETVEHHDKSLLKASGFLGYEHTIWPTSHCAFDLLTIDLTSPTELFLNSSLDVSPRRPVLNATGDTICSTGSLRKGIRSLKDHSFCDTRVIRRQLR